MDVKVKDVIDLVGDFERVDILSYENPGITFAEIELGVQHQEIRTIDLKTNITYEKLLEDMIKKICVGNYEVDYALLVYVDREGPDNEDASTD